MRCWNSKIESHNGTIDYLLCGIVVIHFYGCEVQGFAMVEGGVV